MLKDTNLPQVGYKFAVIISTTGIANHIDIRFKEVSGLKLSRGITRNGSMTSLEAEIPLQTLVLKRGVFTGISLLTIGNAIEAFFWKTRMLRKDILVCTLDENGDVVSEWNIRNAYLEAWEWDGFNAGSNELLVETMTFKYSKIRYNPLG